MNRRRFLTAVGSAATASTAGCLGIFGPCNAGETWEGTSVELRNPVARRVDKEWQFEVDIVVGFNFARSESLGFEDVGITIYGSDRRKIGQKMADRSVTWGGLSDDKRRTDECGYNHGQTTVSISTTTDEFPQWIAPRLEIARMRGHDDGSRGLRYTAESPPEGNKTRQYKSVQMLGKTWPPIDDSRAEPDGDIESIDFDVESCSSDPESYANYRHFTAEDGSGGSASLRWHRKLEDPCDRPLLESVEIDREVGLVVARVGLHQPERAGCPEGCFARGYRVQVEIDGPVPVSGRIVHLDKEGNVVDERTIRPVGDS